jgi:FKBP-type peptidyl-prolyl cis-trans isomerase
MSVARRTLAAALLALAPLAAACRDVAAPREDPARTTYAPALGVDLSTMTRTESGLYYRDVIVGSGAVADSGKVANVFYAGWLTNGRQFDSNRGGNLFPFRVGGGTVIRGWDEGVRGMRVGSRRRLVIPPELGYGSVSQQRIPAGSVLVFDIDLVSVTTPAN